MNWVLAWPLALWVIPCSLGVYNLITWRRARAPSATEGPSHIQLSVLIPARNEAGNIGAALASVLNAKDQHKLLLEVIVYDDQSQDDTAQIVRTWAMRDERVRLISGRPLPEGWVGKPHACQKLFEAAKGSHLLFLDADVRLKTDAFAILTGFTTAGRGPLITAVPQQLTGSWFETMMLPLLHLTYVAWLPLAWSNRQHQPTFSAACGQLIFVHRSDLQQLGGFASVRGEVVDDLALVRFAKTQGMSALFVDGFSIATCRMYRSTGGLWRGFSKNLYLGLGGPIAFFTALILNGTCFILPFLCAIAAVLFPGILGSDALTWACSGVVGNLLLRVLLASRFAHRIWAVVLQPIAVGVLIVLACNSWRWVRRGAVHWAGRSYAPKKLARSLEGASHA